jgi:hypothetical protein
VVVTFKEYNTEWDHRFGWGYYSAIVPREMASVGKHNIAAPNSKHKLAAAAKIWVKSQLSTLTLDRTSTDLVSVK